MDVDVLLGAYDAFRGWFWNKTFWLPANRTWDDLRRSDAPGSPFYPDIYDLLIVFPIAVVLFLARLLWERFIALPIGRYYKVRGRPPTPAVSNALLESAFKRRGKILPKHGEIVELSKRLGWEPRQIERWWRRRRSQGKLSELQRFRETSWRFLFYLLAFWAGLYVIWDKPWLWDTKHCWYGYPLQHVSADIWWYYMLELGFYVSLILSLFMDDKRSDFWQMVVHHVATLSLVVMSWTANMVRVGTLVLCVHDAVDYFLEGAKMAVYCKCSTLRDGLFVAFAVVWVLTRMIFYPFWILRSTLFEGHVIIGMANVYYAYNGLLCTLQVLHCIWFYMIVRMVYFYVIKGEVEKDTRSDTEVEETGSEDESIIDKPTVNNNATGNSEQKSQPLNATDTRDRQKKSL